jgi:chaperone modulatory protein CbpM
VKVDLTDETWLDCHCELSLTELTQLADLSEAELRDLVEYGALEPTDPQASPWMFSGDCVMVVRSACRLRNEFDLDTHALALALQFLHRIRDLEAQLRSAHAQLPQRRH